MASAHPRPPVSQGKASYAISTYRREGDRDAPPKPGPSGGRSATDRLAHCPQRSQRPRVDTERHRLATTKPAAAVCPVIDRGRGQHLGAARHEHAPDCPLHRPTALRRRVRFFAQVWMVLPFCHGVPFSGPPALPNCAKDSVPHPQSFFVDGGGWPRRWRMAAALIQQQFKERDGETN